MDENTHNPTIAKAPEKPCSNHFLIKYKTDEQRRHFSNLIIQLVKKHEVKDFHIEEKEAFEEVRVLYNTHTLFTGDRISYEELEKRFLESYEN